MDRHYSEVREFEFVTGWGGGTDMLHQFDETRSKFAPYGLTCELWKPQPASRPDCHDELELNFVERGTITYFLGGQRMVVQPGKLTICLLYTSPSPRDGLLSRMPSSA